MNILKAQLRKNHLFIDSNDYTAQVVVKGNRSITDIVDELLKEDIKLNRETVLDIVTRFNRKSADMVLSGCTVNNGLVNMRSSVRGFLNEGKWNQNTNWVDVTISHGSDLYQAVAETTVEIMDEKEAILESYNLSNQTNLFSGSIQNRPSNVEMNGSELKIAGEPACGIAFRRWLCKA